MRRRRSRISRRHSKGMFRRTGLHSRSHHRRTRRVRRIHRGGLRL